MSNIKDVKLIEIFYDPKWPDNNETDATYFKKFYVRHQIISGNQKLV